MVAAECKSIVLSAVYMEAIRKDIQQVRRQNSARTLCGSCELPTITALAGQVSHDMLSRLIHGSFFKLRSN